MHLGNRNPHHAYLMNGHELETTECEKDLGVHIDNQLKFHIHSVAASKKADRILGLIKKTYITRDKDNFDVV